MIKPYLPTYPILQTNVTGNKGIILFGLIEILHFEDFGDTSHLAANAVVLVPGEYQISIAKWLRGLSAGETCQLRYRT